MDVLYYNTHLAEVFFDKRITFFWISCPNVHHGLPILSLWFSVITCTRYQNKKFVKCTIGQCKSIYFQPQYDHREKRKPAVWNPRSPTFWAGVLAIRPPVHFHSPITHYNPTHQFTPECNPFIAYTWITILKLVMYSSGSRISHIVGARPICAHFGVCVYHAWWKLYVGMKQLWPIGDARRRRP